MDGIAPGERIRRWRTHRGLSMARLAEGASMHTSSIHRIEHGQQQARAEELERIATALDLTMAEFYGAAPAAPEGEA